MAGNGERHRNDAFDTVSGVLAAPDDARGELPALMGMLDNDDQQIRLAGAMSVCLVAVADPEAVPAVLSRLADRLAGAGHPEVRFAYEYLVSQFPGRADRALREREETAGEGFEGGEGPYESSNDVAENVGRVRPPGVGSFDPRTSESNPRIIDPDDPQRNSDADSSKFEDSSIDDPDDARSRQGRKTTAVTERQQWNRLFERLSVIVEHSRFDDLMVLSGRKRDRYAEVTRVLADDEGVERAVALRLFHRPDEEVTAFSEALLDALEQWQSISDHPNVTSLYTWGRQPRPWAATEPPEATLSDRGGALETTVALSLTLELADALAYAHQRGVVHGGIDPENVTLPGASVPSTGTLDNVALLEVFRWYVTPASCLDPRYAAPEYYDRRFGQITHGTDIYQLGAVLYRALTGRPPFRGTFEEIRTGVMQDSPETPSAVRDVPADLDRIVTKAMAKHTLTRYETINDFRREVAHVHEELTDAD